MADVTLTYKGQNILELSVSGNKTIKTAGKYCEADIGLSYVKSGGVGSNVINMGILSNNIFAYCSVAEENYVPVRIHSGNGMGARVYHYQGVEYWGNIYGNTSLIESANIVLLADCGNGASSAVLLDSLENYSAVILQGVYNSNRASGYNTSMLYAEPEIGNGRTYWAGMKDRNSNHDTFVEFTDATHATITGKKMVMIYGVP